VKGRKNFILTDRGKRALAAYTSVTRELEMESLVTEENVAIAIKPLPRVEIE
jgi:predicted transcriptional regulator